MANLTLQQLLYPQVILEGVTNRIKKTNDTLQRFWGFEMGSANREEIPGRTGTYDIFDNVQDVANFRAPNTGPASVAPQAVHSQPVTCVRIYEKIPLLYEKIFPIRRLGKPSTVVDPGGAEYIQRQEGILRTRFDNAREALTAGMMRSTIQVLVSGENWIPVFSGGTFTISWQYPTTNINQLNGSIASTWLNPNVATVFEDILATDALATQLSGSPIRHVWVTSVVWGYVTNNAGIKARAGSSNVVFTSFNGLGQVNNTDYNVYDYQAELRCLPGIRWHIYNGGAKINGTFTKWLPDTYAGFFPEPDKDIAQMIHGSEYIQENEYQPAAERHGPYFYPMYVREPAKVEITGWDCVMPALRVPNATFAGTVVF